MPSCALVKKKAIHVTGTKLECSSSFANYARLPVQYVTMLAVHSNCI